MTGNDKSTETESESDHVGDNPATELKAGIPKPNSAEEMTPNYFLTLEETKLDTKAQKTKTEKEEKEKKRGRRLRTKEKDKAKDKLLLPSDMTSPKLTELDPVCCALGSPHLSRNELQRYHHLTLEAER